MGALGINFNELFCYGECLGTKTSLFPLTDEVQNGEVIKTKLISSEGGTIF